VRNYINIDQLEGRTNGPNSSFNGCQADWNGLQQVVVQFRRKLKTAFTNEWAMKILYDSRFRTCRYFDVRRVRVSISIPVKLGHGPIGRARVPPYFFNLHQRSIFSMEDGVAEEIQASVRFVTLLNASYCNLKSNHFYSRAIGTALNRGYPTSTWGASSLSFSRSSAPMLGTCTPAHSATLNSSSAGNNEFLSVCVGIWVVR